MILFRVILYKKKESKFKKYILCLKKLFNVKNINIKKTIIKKTYKQ